MAIKLLALLFTLQVLSQISNSLPAGDTAAAEDDDSEDDIGGMGQIGLAYEGAPGCDNGKFFMERYIGLQPKLENYYNATVDLGDGAKEGDFGLKIEFATSANVIVDPSAARVDHLEGNVYMMTIPGDSQKVRFTVRAAQGKPFPAVKLLELDGKSICNLVEWKPTLIGPSAKAVSVSILPRSSVIPYCGRKRVDHTALVTKGELTKEGDWPWHAALYRSNANGTVWRYLCGATVVSRKAVVTAAHCVVERGRPLDACRFKVVVGKYNLDSALDQHAVEIMVKEVIIHNDFIYSDLKNDIAILKVCEDIEYTDYVQPACIWDTNEISKQILYGEFGTVVGWGADENDKLSEKLTVGAMRVVPDAVCLKSLPSFFTRFLNDQSFCAGNGPKNGTSACNGDSGGGFVFPVRQADGLNTWYLRGVVSLSVRRADRDVCDPRHYIVLTDTAAFLAWITEQGRVI